RARRRRADRAAAVRVARGRRRRHRQHPAARSGCRRARRDRADQARRSAAGGPPPRRGRSAAHGRRPAASAGRRGCARSLRDARGQQRERRLGDGPDDRERPQLRAAREADGYRGAERSCVRGADEARLALGPGSDAMNHALWVAKTGLDAQQTRISVIANNLANVNTNGFKKGRAVFEDLVYQNVRQPGAQSSQETQLPSGLMLVTGVRTVATEKLYTQGNLVQTDNALDVAIEGRGFFQVLMPDGTMAYTR